MLVRPSSFTLHIVSFYETHGKNFAILKKEHLRDTVNTFSAYGSLKTCLQILWYFFDQSSSFEHGLTMVIQLSWTDCENNNIQISIWLIDLKKKNNMQL